MRLVPGAEIRRSLRERREIALIDLREEDSYARSHPLFAACLPIGRIELEIYDRVPRRETPIVLYDDGEGFVAPAAQRLAQFGYSDVTALEGGLDGWRTGGGELFIDVNVPSKAFGELVESQRHTPSLSAEEVKALIDKEANIVVLDARRFDEYHTMNIPGGISVPGAELVLRAQDLAPDPQTTIIVNCAGRTRSIIGTQSLVNAGIKNKVAALRNGTIGWTLAGQTLEHAQERRFGEVTESRLEAARATSRAVADRAGVKRLSPAALKELEKDIARTTYRFDVRTQEEYCAGHPPGFRLAPGGQLVQETEFYAPVRGARIVLNDDLCVRANMTGSWLAQMGWEVFVVDTAPGEFSQEGGDWKAAIPPLPRIGKIGAQTVRSWLETDRVTVIDVSASRDYARGHIPGARFALRSELQAALKHIGDIQTLVVTSGDGILATFAASDLQARSDLSIFVLDGGTASWQAAGYQLETGLHHLASPPIDRYRRPYEGTDNPTSAMQAYLDWEFGLVEQLDRDGTHGFFVL